MTPTDIIKTRLLNQQISARNFKTPEEIVAWQLGFQAQDFTSSKWAIGMRLSNTTEAEVEKALLERKIIRSWPMRGTIHIIAAADVHWMFDLLKPHILRIHASVFREQNLNEAILLKSNDVLQQLLENKKELTREELSLGLKQKGIEADKVRLSCILTHAGLSKLIHFGTKRDAEFTYSLYHSLPLQSTSFEIDEAAAHMAYRFFNSHGPATLEDFTWWSGLSRSKAKIAIELAKVNLQEIKDKDQTYWMSTTISPLQDHSTTFLLPSFDEYLMGYRDRSFFLDSKHQKDVILKNGLFKSSIIIDGKIIGTWKRINQKEAIQIEATPFIPLNERQKSTIHKEAERYARFLEKPLLDVKYIHI